MTRVPIGNIPYKLREGPAARRFYRQNGRCFLCGEPLDHTTNVDHFIPLSRGGHLGWRNCCLMHERCNSMKASTLPVPFMVAKFKFLFRNAPLTYSCVLADLYTKAELETIEILLRKMRASNTWRINA